MRSQETLDRAIHLWNSGEKYVVLLMGRFHGYDTEASNIQVVRTD